MQTFIVAPTFSETAKLLDNKRLGKQRVETKQILQTNLKLSIYKSRFGDFASPIKLAWKNHPAVKMWRGYDNMLALYGYAICKEWINRGFSDSLLPFFREFVATSGPLLYPPWLINPTKLHRIIISHRSSLRSKDDNFYGPLFPDSEVKYGYYWPV